MTYLSFHLIFNVPVLLLLGWLCRKRTTRTHLKWIGVVLLIAVVFAAIWDNLAIYKNFWRFDNTKVLFRIGYVPVEEYLFFIIITLQVSLLTLLFLPKPSTSLSQ